MVKLWDVQTGGAGPEITGDVAAPVWCVAFNPDGKTLAWGTGHYEGIPTVRLWNVDKQEVIKELQHKATFFRVTSVAFRPDGKTLAASGQNETIELWDVASAKVLQTLIVNRAVDTRRGDLPAVAFSPDGKSVASAVEFPKLKMWDAATGRQQRTLTDEDQPIGGVCYSPDGTILAATGRASAH